MALKIEAGKFYSTRDGRKVGPMEFATNADWVAMCEGQADKWGYHKSGRGGTITGVADGAHRTPAERARDLIAEWTDEPADEDRPHMTLPNGDVIYEGEYGVTRAGEKVGPMRNAGYNDGYDWVYDGGPGCWSDNGHRQADRFRPHTDIIDKWRDTTETPAIPFQRPFDDWHTAMSDNPSAETPCTRAPIREGDDNAITRAVNAAMELPHGHARLPSGDVVDMTAITTPFGLLDEVYGEGTQEALRAHGGPWEIYARYGWMNTTTPSFASGQAYRVKPHPPAPKVEEVVLGGFQWNCEWHFRGIGRDARQTHRITLTMRDGVLDPVAKVEAL